MSEFMRRRDLLAGAAFGAALSVSQPANPKTKPAKFRVAIIGRTGKGNYGHGLDVAVQDYL